MNHSAIFGITATATVIVMAILLGAPLVVFMDIPSAIIVVVGTICLTLASHGMAGLAAIRNGLAHILLPAWFTQVDWGAKEYREVSQVARTAGFSAIMLAACGALIGLTQMFQSMDDPAHIGPAMAVCLLTSFYAILLNVLIFIPLARYFKEEAITAEASTQGA